MTLDKEVFGSFIAGLRRERKLTQQELAERLHVTDRAVSKWERGLSYPDVTLLEPLAAALGIGVEELLTCRLREAAQPPEEPAALRSVLAISGEVQRQRQRRMIRYTVLAVVLVLVMAVLTLLQQGGRLRIRQRAASPDGTMTMTVYRSGLFGGTFVVQADHPFAWEGSRCQYCGRGAPELVTRRRLEESVTAVESLQWSADGRYLLLCGTTTSATVPGYIGLWDFAAYGAGSPVRAYTVDSEILVLLAGYGDPANPTTPLLPVLPGVGAHTFLPGVTLSDAYWTGDGYELAMNYAYEGTDGRQRSGGLRYDVKAREITAVYESRTAAE